MIESGRGSVSLLQSVGWALDTDELHALLTKWVLAGIVGRHNGSVAREVLITLEDWEEMQQMEAEDTPTNKFLQVRSKLRWTFNCR